MVQTDFWQYDMYIFGSTNIDMDKKWYENIIFPFSYMPILHNSADKRIMTMAYKPRKYA